jgi:hypothetical protein
MTVGMKRSNMRSIDKRWVGGMGRIGFRAMAFEAIRAVAKMDLIGRMVKLYRKPSRQSSDPNNVT